MKARLTLALALAATTLAVATLPALAAPSSRVSVKTDWGIITVPVVKAPKPGKCVRVSAKVDVRNSANVPQGGINMGIADDFGNLVAYTEWSSFVNVNGQKDLSQSKPNGVYRQPMVACAKATTWTDPYRPNVTLPLVPVEKKESYTFTVITSFDRNFEGDGEYRFKK